MINFVYDPQRQGYDTALWKTLSGVPSIASNNLVLNAASIVGYADLTECDLSLRLELPEVPTAGDSREFGLASVNLGAFIIFKIDGIVLTIEVADGKGNTKSGVVAFDSAWAKTPIDFEIRWRGTYADFLISGVGVINSTDPAGASYRINDIAVPKGPLSVYVKNANSDNLEIISVSGKNIKEFI